MIIYFIIFLIIIILFIILFNVNYINYENFNVFDNNTYKNIMLNNNEKNLYKIGLDKNVQIYRDDCFQKCDSQSCIKLDQKRKILNKCLKCNSQKNKCFNKNIIGGVCDDCSAENSEDKINCYEIGNFGCVNPNYLNNIQNNIGIDPYYIEVPDHNINSPFNKKCVFCWNILDNI